MMISVMMTMMMMMMMMMIGNSRVLIEELLTIKRVLDFKTFMHHDISIIHSVHVVTDKETSMVMIIDTDGDECGIIVYEGQRFQIGIKERNTTYLSQWIIR